MPPARLQVQDAARVADRQHRDPALHSPGHGGLGGFVLGLPDPPQVPGLGVPLPALVLAPPPRSALSWLGVRRAAARVRPLRSRR